MNSNQSNLIERLKDHFENERNVVYNEELECLFVRSYNTWLHKLLVYKIEMKPGWGCRVAVSPIDEIVAKDDECASKMIEFVHLVNYTYLLLSYLYYDLEEKSVYVACNIFYDEEPTDEEIALCFDDAVKTLASYEEKLRAVAAGDFSPFNDRDFNE